jgi:hypothetical protein
MADRFSTDQSNYSGQSSDSGQSSNSSRNQDDDDDEDDDEDDHDDDDDDDVMEVTVDVKRKGKIRTVVMAGICEGELYGDCKQCVASNDSDVQAYAPTKQKNKMVKFNKAFEEARIAYAFKNNVDLKTALEAISEQRLVNCNSCRATQGLYESEKRKEKVSVADPIVESTDNPNGLPIWSAVRGSKQKKNDWKGEAGKLYWHPKHKIEGVGVKQYDRVVFVRACDRCKKQTQGLKEEHCAACGGKKQVPKTCQVTDAGLDGKKCTNNARHTEGDVRMCPKHYVACNPGARGCPMCKIEPLNASKEDKCCSTCTRKKKVELQRNAQRPLLETLMEEEGIEEWPGHEHAEPWTRYAALNYKDGHAPFVIVKSGKNAIRACASTGCCQMAMQNPDTGEFKWCKQHGGGRRCKGADPKTDGCPLGMSISREDDTRHIPYDGLCVGCFCEAFPEDPRAINAKKWFKVKEKEVIAVLQSDVSDLTLILDTAFAVGVRDRPDARGDPFPGRIILFDNDENRHETYGDEEERAREKRFFDATPKDVTIVIVRFNPDNYIDEKGVKHPSCFTRDRETGMVMLNPAQETQWKERCAHLVATMRKYMDPNTPVPPPQAGRTIFSEELFYGIEPPLSAEAIERKRARLKSLGKLRKRQRLESSNAEVGGSSSV